LKRLTVFALVVAAVGIGWMATRRSAPPEVPFARIGRETITSSIPTNGKVEPLESVMVRAERAGAVSAVRAAEGENVKRGAVLVELDTRDARADLSAAQARISEARAQQQTVEQGGRAAERAEIDSGLETARQTLRVVEQEYATEQRLMENKATTRAAVTQARDAVERARLQIQALERRRAALVSAADRTVAEARIKEAASSAALAQNRIDLSVIRAPMDGVLFQFRTEAPARAEIKVGTYLQPGDLVARVGRLDRMRVRVYVDEPELGRVAKGMPVNITWAARPGRRWSGEVDKVPVEVFPLGTRQVGEVEVIIGNPDHELLPGTNVDAEIVSRVVKDALALPKEALRREENQDVVLALDPSNNTVATRKLKLGAISIAKAEVVSGLKEGDMVALPVERMLKAGDKVTPVSPGQ
jgi:HlyD family secretion protein